MATWEITSKVLFPLAQTAVGGNGGIPENLHFESRFVDGDEVKIDDVTIALKKPASEDERNTLNAGSAPTEPALLVCTLDDEDGMKAMERSIPYIEWACDQLSYFSQHPIKVVSSELRAKDNNQDKNIFPMPRQPAKFRKSVYMNADTPKMIPLWPPPAHFSERDFAILRWYHKSLAAEYEVDRFVFLWVCLEIICKASDFVVKAPYVNQPCGHEIIECPECGSKTEKEVNGKTLQGFLTSHLNVDAATAKGMWRFRQLLHGQNKLNEQSMKDAEKLIMSLQAAVNLGVKRRFGFKDTDPPIVLPQGLSFSSIGFEITMK